MCPIYADFKRATALSRQIVEALSASRQRLVNHPRQGLVNHARESRASDFRL